MGKKKEGGGSSLLSTGNPGTHDVLNPATLSSPPRKDGRDNSSPSGKNKEGNNMVPADGGELVLVDKPGTHDVLLGRGSGTNRHSGNIRFRKLINEHKLRYRAAKRKEKPNIGKNIVKIWRNLQPPGRFLAKSTDGEGNGCSDGSGSGSRNDKVGPGGVKQPENVWFEVGDQRARKKVTQALRERTFSFGLYKMLHDATNPEIVEWVDGQLRVHDFRRLQSELLPEYFGSRICGNIHAFLNRLENHGFQRVGRFNMMFVYANDEATSDVRCLLRLGNRNNSKI